MNEANIIVVDCNATNARRMHVFATFKRERSLDRKKCENSFLNGIPYFKTINQLVSVAGAVIPCVWEAVSSGWCEVVQGVGSDYIVVWGQHRVCQ